MRTVKTSGANVAAAKAFNMLELLVVVAIILLLAGLLIPALVKAKAQAQSASCKNNLRQIGIGLNMYISESGRYPAEWSRNAGSYLAWADQLSGNGSHNWTNASRQCPAYAAKQGLIEVIVRRGDVEIFTSYAYNEWGMVDTSRHPPRLGLGLRPGAAISESQVAAPGELFAIADSRTFRNAPRPPYGVIVPLHGLMQMNPFFSYREETEPLHGQGYNILFADGHVALVKRRQYLYPPLAAPHWNRDNQPHPELWRSANEWAEQK